MTLLRAMDPAYSTDADIIRAFYPTETIKVTAGNRAKLEGRHAVGDVIDPETGEVYLESGETFTEEKLDQHSCHARQGSRRSSRKIKDALILNSLNEDPTNTHEEALLKIYQRLRPGNPPQLEKARSCSRRSSRTPTAIGWARSAASASTASSIRTSTRRR